MLVITGPNGGGKSTWPRYWLALRKQTAEKFIWMMRTLQDTILIIVQMRELAMHFSSHPALKV